MATWHDNVPLEGDSSKAPAVTMFAIVAMDHVEAEGTLEEARIVDADDNHRRLMKVTVTTTTPRMPAMLW